MARWFALLLIAGVVRADVAVPKERPRAGWAQTCSARLETARDEAAKIVPELMRGKVEVMVDEEVLPLVEHVRFSATATTTRTSRYSSGVWVTVEPTRKKMLAGRWESRHFDPGVRSYAMRAINGRMAEVRVSVDDEAAQARLVQLWQTAADDCLAARL